MGNGNRPAKRGQKEQQVSIQHAHYEGPLPPPALLRQYDEIHPGFADRIIAGWEAETAHRHELERTVVSAEIEAQKHIPKEIKRGQVLAFVLSLFFLATGAFLAYCDKQVSGTILGSTGFLGVIASFLTSAFDSRKKGGNGK